MPQFLYKFEALPPLLPDTDDAALEEMFLKDFAVDSLLKRYFWFSRADQFNDPFDCNFESVFQSAEWGKVLGYLTQYPDFDHDFKESMNSFAIYCLTHSADNQHFWAHYAGNYSGFTIEYDGMHIEESLRDKAFLHKVTYLNEPIDIDAPIPAEICNKNIQTEDIYSKSTHYAFSELYRVLLEEQNRQKMLSAAQLNHRQSDFFDSTALENANMRIINIINWILTSKAYKAWNAEEEYRFIAHPYIAYGYDDTVQIDEAGKGIRIKYDNPKVVRAVVFGHKTSERYIALFKKYLPQFGYDTIAYKRIKPNYKTWSLDVEDV